MVKIADFHVEQWMDRFETTPGVLNIAETCAASVSLDELCSLSDDKSSSPFDSSLALTYGPMRGSSRLCESLARLHGGPDVGPEHVIVTQGAIAANFLVFYSLVGPGDHVVCVHPTYQQLYSVPESLGCDVSLWQLQPEKGYLLDVSDLAKLVRPNTKMIVINNPNNPSGARIGTKVLEEVIEFARSRDLMLLSDEVYRPLFHDVSVEGAAIPPTATSMGYKKTIVTGSMSKAYALAGIRIGWAICPDEAMVRSMAVAREHTTISVSRLDDQVACFALSEAVRPALLMRNVELATNNLKLLADFVAKYGRVCSWTRPDAGTTAFVQFKRAGQPVNDEDFCVDVINNTKVFIVPGSKCFGDSRGLSCRGFVRIGYAGQTRTIVEALEKLGEYLDEHFASDL